MAYGGLGDTEFFRTSGIVAGLGEYEKYVKLVEIHGQQVPSMTNFQLNYENIEFYL
jgi:hypothetical protein